MKIEKCPFCGGEARIKSRYIGYGSVGLGARDWYTVECNECRAKSDEYGAELEAIAAWNRRAQPENEPLTTSELRKMDGEPVYVITLDNPLENQPYWAIAGINSNDSRHQNGVALYNRVQGDWGAFDLYGKTWLAYRSKPKEEQPCD